LEYVKLKDFTLNSDVNSVRSITTGQELRNLIDNMRATQTAFAENDARLVTVRRLVPELTLQHWVLIDESTKETLFGIAKNSFTSIDILSFSFLVPLPSGDLQAQQA